VSVEVSATAALAALLLLPGLLVVRAPWHAVPFLSLFFWIASWWWLPSVGRTRFIGAALAAFVLAGVLRLLRFDGRWPSWPSLLAVAAALVHAAVCFVADPGRRDGVPAQLMVWHDGLPQSYVPVREAGGFAAHPHGGDAVAADAALLSGAAVPRLVPLAAAAAGGLASIGAYSLLVRVQPAALAAYLTLASSLAAALLEGLGEGLGPSASLALGFVLNAAGLLARARSRASAVGAGAFAATALLTAPWVLGAGLAVVAVVAAIVWGRIPAAERAVLQSRLVVAGGVAALVAAPFLGRVAAGLLSR
jgi:hypothetical protein